MIKRQRNITPIMQERVIQAKWAIWVPQLTTRTDPNYVQVLSYDTRISSSTFRYRAKLGLCLGFSGFRLRARILCLD
jgi:hypothetical protein